MKYYFFILVSSIIVNLQSYAQDIHFSQFNENPALVNPALTGANDVLRASLNYKDQWRGVTVPYKTYGASVEMKLRGSEWEQIDKYSSMTFKQKSLSHLTAGLSFYNDRAGDGNMGISQINLSLATFVPISSKSSLSLGLQGCLVQRKIDYSKLIFPNQYNGSGYDPHLASGENMASQNFIYPDLGTGVLWSYNSNKKNINNSDQLKFNAGVSIYHITQPKLTYLKGSTEKVYLKYIIHGNSLIGIPNYNLAISPSYLFQYQGSLNEFIVGTMLKYYLRTDTKYTGFIKQSCVSVGGYYRNRDAVILSALLEWEQYGLGFSYDLNISGLSRASSARGGPEITLRYTTAKAFLYQKRTN